MQCRLLKLLWSAAAAGLPNTCPTSQPRPSLPTNTHLQTCDVVGPECLEMMQRFKGGILGEGHSWVAAPKPIPVEEPAPVAQPASLLPLGTVQFQELPVTSSPSAPAAPAGVQSAASLQAQILDLVGEYIPGVDPQRALGDQGLDSLSALELRQKIQEATGLELMTLIEDPQGATVAAIAQEAAAAAAAVAPAPVAAQQGLAQPQHQAMVAVQRRPAQAAQAAGHLWISPAPFAIKMRVYCLPYAGGMSENVYAR